MEQREEGRVMTVYGSSAKFRRLYFGPALGLYATGKTRQGGGRRDVKELTSWSASMRTVLSEK